MLSGQCYEETGKVIMKFRIGVHDSKFHADNMNTMGAMSVQADLVVHKPKSQCDIFDKQLYGAKLTKMCSNRQNEWHGCSFLR